MEEAKQHEAAELQPGTEALAAEQPAAQVPVELADNSEVSPAGTPADEDPASSDAGDEIADDVVEEEIPSAEAEVETTEGAALPDDAEAPSDTDSDTDIDTEADDDAEQPDQQPSDDAPLPDDHGSDAESDSDLEADTDADADAVTEEAEASPETSIGAFELLGATGDQATAAETDAATLKAVLEAIVYVLPEPVPAAQMAAALNQPLERVESILQELMGDTANPERGVFIREVAGGYQVATKPEHHEAIRNFVKNLKQPLKLSNAALETLAVIAYKQPVTAPEIMEIRGVQGVGVLKTLLDRKLITTAGRKNVIGKPILYKTTKEFLTQFGLNRLSELPTLKEFEEIRRQSMSDDEIEDRPEAHPSAPLLQQAAALDKPALDEMDEKTVAASDDQASEDQPDQSADESSTPEEHQAAEQDEPSAADAPPAGTTVEPEPHAEVDPLVEAEPQSEAPPTPESQENHG